MRNFSKTDALAMKNGYKYHVYVGNCAWKDRKLLLSVKYSSKTGNFIVKNWKANESRVYKNQKQLSALLRKVMDKYGSYSFIITRRD